MSLARSQCNSCNEPIYWVSTDNGKQMPINVEPAPHGNLLLAAGESPPRVSVISKNGRLPDMKLYVSHFSTCRFAKRHRRRNAEPPVQPRPNPPTVDLFSEVGG